MNSLVITEALLMGAAVYVAVVSRRCNKALLIASVIIAIAALLGFLKYSNLLPLPQLHQLFAMLSSAVALPLIAVAVIWPDDAVNKKIRYAGIFAFIAAFLGIILVTISEIEIWRLICAIAAAHIIMLTGLWRKHWLVFVAGLMMVIALAIVGLQKSFYGLHAADYLHVLLAAALLLLMQHFNKRTNK